MNHAWQESERVMEARKEGQVSVVGFLSSADERGWQYKSSQEASQCVSPLCPAGIFFTALKRIHTKLDLIRAARLVKK